MSRLDSIDPHAPTQSAVSAPDAADDDTTLPVALQAGGDVVPKHERRLSLGDYFFVRHYVATGGRAAESYRRVYGPDAPNASSRGCALVKRLRPYIRAYTDKLTEQAEASADDMVRRLTSIAYDPDASRTDQIRAIETLARIRGLSGDHARRASQPVSITLDLGGHPPPAQEAVTVETDGA